MTPDLTPSIEPPPAAAEPNRGELNAPRAVVAILPSGVYAAFAAAADVAGVSVGAVVARAAARTLGFDLPLVAPRTDPAPAPSARATSEKLPPEFWRRAARAAFGPRAGEPVPPSTGPVPTGQDIKTLREARGLSQTAAAALCNVSRSNLSEMEAGRRSSPDTLRHVAARLRGAREVRG